MTHEDIEKYTKRGNDISAIASMRTALRELQLGNNKEAELWLCNAMSMAVMAVDERNKLAHALLVARSAMRGNAMRYIDRASRLLVEDACDLATMTHSTPSTHEQEREQV